MITLKDQIKHFPDYNKQLQPTHPVRKFLEEKESSIAIVGLGYVGLPLAVRFGKVFRVIGCDINQRRITELTENMDATGEIAPNVLASADITFTSDISSIRDAKIVVVAVPTPVNERNTPDFGPLKSASEAIGRHIRSGTYVVYESTVYPGATEEICVPIIEQASGLKRGIDFKIGYSPERINPGDNENTLQKIVKIVSADDAESLEAIAQSYEAIIEAGVHRVSSIMVAEAAKLFENTQRDVNIAIVNELARLCHKLNIATNEVLDACATKWNFVRFSPGLVGGHCIAVDPYYFIAKAEEFKVDAMVSRSARITNNSMAEFIVTEVMKKVSSKPKLGESYKISILGVTYKEDCGDIRSSLVFELARGLKNYGCEIHMTDPIACADEVQNEYGFVLEKFEDLTKSDAIMVAVPHRSFRELQIEDLKNLCGESKVVVDIKGALDRHLLEASGFDYWRL